MTRSWWKRGVILGSTVGLLGAAGATPTVPEPGLLFYVSGDRGVSADVSAGGTPTPNYASDVTVIQDGAFGQGLECGHTQLLAYHAPGNIFAQRGTLSFFWRSREPVGPTEFPVFRVGYGDHSSWDMVWLRIDYNGKGFDAFVTDASLARTRVSVTLPTFPNPKQWTHIALSWDETQGIRFYVDGTLAASKQGVSILDAALDQFGPHSRIISPYQVQSAYNFVRGGDIDEVRIYDRMLSDANVANLARGAGVGELPAVTRTLDTPQWRDEWWFRNGWNRTGDAPATLDTPVTTIRKVEIHDAWDLKRWWWKSNDGIRETTWPGVYNRSRLPGRNDYFQLPDWDCYSLSGKTITWTMPDEPWNHLEMSGAAWGAVRLGTAAEKGGRPLFERPKGQERTYHRLASPIRGQSVTFTNVEQETPLGEVGAYFIGPGAEPEGIGKLAYRLTQLASTDYPSLVDAMQFIQGRHTADERTVMVALPAGMPRTPRAPQPQGLPLVHVLIPSDFRDAGGRGGGVFSWKNLGSALDGIAISLPALQVVPTHGAVYPLRIQVKDPIWPLRNMVDVSVAVRPGEARTIWIDMRDRILPADKGLYLTLAGAGSGFGAAALEGAEVRLIFRPRKDGLAEHTLDRFTQVRDLYAHLVEESPRTRRLALFRRWENDLTDLLAADPEHRLGREYWYDFNKEQPAPAVDLANPPAGVPRWAFRQTELLREIKQFVRFYIEKRQLENGEFGGGLSDDGDLTNAWPATALMSGQPEPYLASLDRHMDAFYEQGMFSNGLSTIQTDELHSYEEGIQVLGQTMLLDFGNPKEIERAMETARALEHITGINKAGHRHIRSSYFSGTKIATDGVWGWQKTNSFLALHPAMSLVDFNGAPHVRTWLTEVADGLLAHYTAVPGTTTKQLHTNVEFATDHVLSGPDRLGSPDRAWSLLWAAYRWTGDRKYMVPILDLGGRGLLAITGNVLDVMDVRQSMHAALLQPEWLGSRPDAARHFAWQVTGDLSHLDTLYDDQVRTARLRRYINTDGSLWTDRVQVPMPEIQRARLGGIALVRNAVFPGHTLSWRFDPGDDEQVGLLIPDATPTHLTIIGFNFGSAPIRAGAVPWDMEPGAWEVVMGTRADATSGPLSNRAVSTVEVDRGTVIPVAFQPGCYTVIELRRTKAGTPYWQRPDLGIGREDVVARGRTLAVTVHSLGAVATPSARVMLKNAEGRVVATARVREMAAPFDLHPKTTTVTLRVAAGLPTKGYTLEVEAPSGVREITKANNRLTL